jgi:purine nucleosidase
MSPARHALIIDGDWGGDEMQVAAVVLSHPETFDLLAATSMFGNTHLEQITDNGLRTLHLLRPAARIPFYEGAAHPSDSPALEGDGAHGRDGIGGVVLPASPHKPDPDEPAVDTILRILREQPEGTVSIIAAGPLTNLALALEKAPEVLRRVKIIVAMGGCTRPIPAADRPFREGNITPHAEFNFQQAATDARVVLNSGLPVVLLPMNCTQQLALTPAREASLRARFSERTGNRLAGMMTAPRALDLMKFNSAPFMHDVHTALYLLDPSQYSGRRGFVEVEVGGERNGHSRFIPDPAGNVQVMEDILHPDHQYHVVEDSLARLLADRS